MSQYDRDKWENRYRQQAAQDEAPSALLPVARPWLPTTGCALDVAGGAGRNGLWLAEQGLSVTVADISLVGLKLAVAQAEARRLPLATHQLDFESDPFPAGPWDAIVQVCFLDRRLFIAFEGALAPGGVLIVAQPTVRNLERHEKPPAPFLLAEGELRTLVPHLEIEYYAEDWTPEGRHEAWLIARKPAAMADTA